MQITTLILSQLIHNEDYTRKVFPFLKDEYFDHPIDLAVFRMVKGFLTKYNKRPTLEVLRVELENARNLGLNEDSCKKCSELIESLKEEEHDLTWLVDTTETWCKDRAIFIALTKSLHIAEGKDKKSDKGKIVSILEDAISVSFDTHIGHDYIADAETRFEAYHKIEDRVRFDIDIFNRITGGGLPKKTLSLLLGGIHVGKTATMCHCAAANLVDGKNVLYITMEMGEIFPGIAERIDANLLDINIKDLTALPKAIYDQKIERIKTRTPGKLIIKEYPTGGANVNHFRHLLHELRFKKKFFPDIIYIDYLNICSSSRVRMNSNIGLYSYVMFITQEVRGFAIENNVPVMSATQLNREGFQSSDPGMEHIAESFGTGATADMMLVLTVTDELASINQIMVKQIKNRFGNMYEIPRFIVGRDINKMRLYNVDKAEKTGNDSPIMDKMIPPEHEKSERRAVMQTWT